MNGEELQKIIYETLENATTANGVSILDKFQPLEVGDFVNAIIMNLPLYPEFIISEIKARVFTALPDELRYNVVLHETKELYRLYITNKHNKEQLGLLIFLLMVQFDQTYLDIGITEQLNDIRDYYCSYPISNLNDLRVEIEENPEQATTIETNNCFVRVKSDYTFVPTMSTKLTYFNYLYNTNT